MKKCPRFSLWNKFPRLYHRIIPTLKKVVLLYNMNLYLRTKKAGFLV